MTDPSHLIARGRRVLAIEAAGRGRAGAPPRRLPSCAPASCCSPAAGRVVVTGMGKSGHVGRKIAATLASTGTPAFFLHPAEASHGDLGMITARRRGAGAVQLRRDAPRCSPSCRCIKRLDIAADRHDRQPGLDAGPRRRRSRWTSSVARGSLPAQPGAHRQHHGHAGDGRRAGDRAARGTRLHRGGFRPLAPGRHPGTPAAAACRGRHAQGRRPARASVRRRRWRQACSR